MRRIAPDWLSNVDIDNEGGTFAAAAHLIERGHRRIAYLPGRTNPPGMQQAGAEERLNGFHRALREAEIAPDPALILPGDYGEPSGQERAECLLALPDPPTAFCCANDALAKGCLAALAARGLRAPDDASVTGFDSPALDRDVYAAPDNGSSAVFRAGSAVGRASSSADP